ncbi:MAG: hypothetical protein KDB07_07435 [Planctomycetes bacterium]|nr:hypothetical protein [Planctomycetota bacterium]
MPGRLIALALITAAQLNAADTVDTSDPFPLAIHLFTIPLTILVGVAIGWALRERKVQMDEARAAMLAESAETAE